MKKTLFINAMMLLVLSCLVMAAPSPSLITTTWTNAMVNISLTDGAGTQFVTVYASSSSTANSSTSKVFNITNSTATNFNAGYANFTLSNAIVLEDSNDYTVSFLTTGNGGADAQTGTTATGVIVSRTTPDAPTTTASQNQVLGNSAAFSYTVTGTATTGCRIAFLPSGIGIRFSGTNTFAMTHSGNTCTYTATSANLPDSDYNVYVQASDGVDTAQSSALVIKFDAVKGGSSAGAYVVQQQAQQKKSNTTLLIIGAAILLYVFRKELGIKF